MAPRANFALGAHTSRAGCAQLVALSTEARDALATHVPDAHAHVALLRVEASAPLAAFRFALRHHAMRALLRREPLVALVHSDVDAVWRTRAALDFLRCDTGVGITVQVGGVKRFLFKI